MADSNGPYLYATIYEFKSKIAKYIRLLEGGRYRAVILKRYNKPVAFVMPYESRVREMGTRQEK